MPRVSGTATAQGGAGQSVVTPRITVSDDGRQAVEKQRCITIVAGQVALARWTMLDQDGLPTYLTGCGFETTPAPPDIADNVDPLTDGYLFASLNGDGGTVKLVVAEAVTGCNVLEFPGAAVNPTTGQVLAHMTPPLCQPGIYDAEFVIINQDGHLLFTNRLTVMVERRVGQAGPPTRQEVRLAIRGSSPADYRLIDGVQFDDVEIATALVSAVRVYNDTPPLHYSASTFDFPSHSQWLLGAQAFMYEMLAQFYRANQLAYSTSAAANIDDMAKADMYEVKARELLTRFTAWATSYKATMSIADSFALINVGY